MDPNQTLSRFTLKISVSPKRAFAPRQFWHVTPRNMHCFSTTSELRSLALRSTRRQRSTLARSFLPAVDVTSYQLMATNMRQRRTREQQQWERETRHDLVRQLYIRRRLRTPVLLKGLYGKRSSPLPPERPSRGKMCSFSSCARPSSLVPTLEIATSTRMCGPVGFPRTPAGSRVKQPLVLSKRTAGPDLTQTKLERYLRQACGSYHLQQIVRTKQFNRTTPLNSDGAKNTLL